VKTFLELFSTAFSHVGKKKLPIRKYSTKKLIKNSEKILRALGEENKQFLFLVVFL